VHISLLTQFCLASVLLLVSALTAGAQPLYESVGTRAQGMAGAFVAVADDATATWWNPAGLATGPVFGLALEQVRLERPPETPEAAPIWRSRARAFSAVFPALGLSHYRLRLSEIAARPPTGSEPPGRQDGQAAAPIGLRAFAANYYGVTVAQSLGSHLVVGSTLKLVRGGVASSEATGDPLKRAESLDVRLHTRGDLDLGAMASFGVVRLALAVKNAREPEWGSGAGRLKLRRQSRVGGAIVAEGVEHKLTLALDADLKRSMTTAGVVRHVASGVEAWLFGRRLGVRGGISANTVGDGGRTASAGVSFPVRRGVYLEGSVTRGSEKAREGWAISLGMMY
jgi:hypothetical protein